MIPRHTQPALASEQEADEHIARTAAAARTRGYLGLQACVYAIPRELGIGFEPPVRAVARLEGRMSTNGHRVGFGFVGGSS